MLGPAQVKVWSLSLVQCLKSRDNIEHLHKIILLSKLTLLSWHLFTPKGKVKRGVFFHSFLVVGLCGALKCLEIILILTDAR